MTKLLRINLDRIVRPELQTMRAYESARSLNQAGEIFLDANEAPASNYGLNRYPPPQPDDLRQQLALYYSAKVDKITMTRGADEAIDLILRLTCRAGADGILICPPTYGMYKVSALLQGTRIIEVPMSYGGGGFQLDVARVKEALCADAIKLVFLCRPNNPTGELLDLETIEELAVACGPSTLLVVDEAYLEFSQAESAASLIDQFSNIVVLRTFSKAWALAGVRFGVAIACAELTAALKKVLPPYPISTPVHQVMLKQLSATGVAQMHLRVQQVNSARQQLRESLQALPSVDAVYPSAANFLLVRVKQAAQLFEYLRGRGIIVRDRSCEPLLEDCLRVSIGSVFENSALFDAWETWGWEQHA